MNFTDLADSIRTLHQLTDLKRKGWLQRGVPPEICESVADHSYNVAKAGYYYTGDLHLVGMLSVHDWPEAICGDVTPRDNVDPQVKHKNEYEAMLQITKSIPFGDKIMTLWLEYEDKSAPLSPLAHQLDKLDAGVKALYYENLGYDTSEFYPYAMKKLDDPILIKIFERLLQRKHPLADSHKVYFGMLSEKSF